MGTSDNLGTDFCVARKHTLCLELSVHPVSKMRRLDHCHLSVLLAPQPSGEGKGVLLASLVDSKQVPVSEEKWGGHSAPAASSAWKQAAFPRTWSA